MMHRLFRLAVTIILIVSFVPSEVMSDGKLQEMADIVRHLSTTRLCAHDCHPVILIKGRNLTLTYETNINGTDDTDALCKCMYKYMEKAIGDATSECKVTETQFAIVFNGLYSPRKKPAAPLVTLSSVLSYFEKPDLGGYEVTKDIFLKNGGFYITLTYVGKKHVTACDGILKYLNQNNFLEGADNKCTNYPELQKNVLDLSPSE